MTSHKTPQERVNEIENIFGISVGAGAGAKNREAREKVLAIFAEQEEEVRRDEREKCEREKDWAVHDATSKLQ